MRSIIVGPSDRDRVVSQQVLQSVKSQMEKPSEDRTQVCNVLRLSKGGYSHRRRRVHKSA
ncbi:hypothetical protein [Brucella rhizosphaerae]|uniref:hypothetical protein n=1 Tax=Brucella rhizosphaerae TaxID=571254 RepID=UPI000B997CC1|nr:hypothetical protein [Brucella rhizosphaerae]